MSAEWSRYLESLNGLANETAYGPGGVVEINADDTWHDDLNAREAVQGVDELRNENATLRGENHALRQSIDELLSAVEGIRRNDDLRGRVEQLENVAEPRLDDQLRSRIEQIEDRLQ